MIRHGVFFYMVEDKQGQLRALIVLRGITPESMSAEVVITFLDDGDYQTPMASEALQFLLTQAFRRFNLRKVVVHCLDCETDLHQFYLNNGFTSNGFQREVLFTEGQWHDLEVLSLFNPLYTV